MRKCLFLGLLIAIFVCTTPIVLAGSSGTVATKQYEWLENQVEQKHAIAQGDVQKLFGITGDGIAVGHHSSMDSNGRITNFTTFQYSLDALPHDAWFSKLQITKVDDTNTVIGVAIFPRDSICVDAQAFVKRYGLKLLSPANPTQGSYMALYSRSVGDGSLQANVPFKPRTTASCVSSATVYLNPKSS